MASRRKIRVLLLMGGPSAEHEVSLATGRKVMAALDRRKYVVRPLVVPRTRISGFNISKFKHSIDVAFIAMHGEFGEDGRLQALLDVAGIPYVGSGVLASALAMDKMRSGTLLRQHGLLVPRQIAFQAADWQLNTAKLSGRIRSLGFPVVVKPVDRGSSVGITIVSKFKGLKDAVHEAARYSSQIMAEEFIPGREVTCGVLEHPKTREPFALPPIEVIPKAGVFYDYKSKYENGGSDHIIPPRMSKHVIREIQQATLVAHAALGCRGMSRADLIVGKLKANSQKPKVYLLEVNTIPGMTETSLLPQAAAAAGIPFPKLLDLLIRRAHAAGRPPGRES